MMTTTQTRRYEPTLIERIVAYWVGTTTAVAAVMVIGSLAQFVSTTF